MDIHRSAAQPLFRVQSEPDHLLRRHRRIERQHLARAPRQHRALVDVALVGDLAGIDAGRLVEDQRARRRLRRAAALGLQRVQAGTQMGLELGARQRAGLRRREDQQADLLAAMAGDDDIGHMRRQRADRTHPQRAHAHPGAAHQLEVLGHAAVEENAALGAGLVEQLGGVADAVEAVGVEGLGGDLGGVAVLGEDVRSAHADLQLAAVGQQLQLDARQRQADAAGAVSVEPHDDVNHSGRPRTLRATASRRSHKLRS